jgi:type II secretory pathway pseudopilin PulG
MCINYPVRGRHSPQSGFSLLEITIVATIVLAATAAAFINLMPSIYNSRSNAGMELVLGELRRAHERAVDERRIYRVTFSAPNTIQVDVGTVAVIGTTITDSVPTFQPAQPPLPLPGNMQFLAIPGIPTGALSTPDGFGSGNNAIDFDLGNGGGGTQVYFEPDGRALDAGNRLNNGVVYIAQPTNLFSSRAVSLYGSTGRTKGWTLTKLAGGATGWTQ